MPNRLLCALMLLLSSVPVRAVVVEVRGDGGDFTSVDLTIADGVTALCTVKRPSTGYGTLCRFELPAGTRALTLRGRYVPQGGQRERSGERRYAVLDLGPATRELAATERPYGERVAAFLRTFDRLTGRGAEHGGHPTPSTAAEIAAAEKRLGYPLPPEFVSLLRTVGPLALGDDWVSKPGEIENAYDQMRHVWGTPDEAMVEEYSEAMRSVLKKSVLLYHEAGDGYGGLLYRPGPTQSCGEQGLYAWTSQEGGTDRLKNPDGSCMDFAAAFRWLVEWELLETESENAAEESTPSQLIVDGAAPVMKLRLEVDSSAEGFAPSLQGHWRGPYDGD
jgi:hypothetical protein